MRAAIRAGLTFAIHAQARPGVHTGWYAQLDSLLALNAALPAAFGAALLDDLTGALAGRASARNGEKALLIGELAPTAAGLTGDDTGAGLRARAVASLAEFLTRDFDFCIDAGSGLFERETHVVAQVGAALYTPATATASTGEKILEGAPKE